MRYLVLRVHSGLGNRIRALVSAVRLAGKTGRHLAVVWELNGYHLWCPFERLFENPVIRVGDDFASFFPNHESHSISRRPTFIDPASDAEVIRVWEENFFWAEGDEGVMWGQYPPHKMRNPALREELLAGFDALSPAPRVRRRVEEFAAAHFDRPVVGVHIRREDNSWSNRHCTDPMFGEAIREELRKLPDASVFLCTDGTDSERRVRKWFPGRVLTYPVRSFRRGADPEAAEDALACILLLSRTRLIIRSSSSTFSQVASWFGRTPTVDVGPHEHPW